MLELGLESVGWPLAKLSAFVSEQPGKTRRLLDARRVKL